MCSRRARASWRVSARACQQHATVGAVADVSDPGASRAASARAAAEGGSRDCHAQPHSLLSGGAAGPPSFRAVLTSGWNDSGAFACGVGPHCRWEASTVLCEGCWFLRAHPLGELGRDEAAGSSVTPGAALLSDSCRVPLGGQQPPRSRSRLSLVSEGGCRCTACTAASSACRACSPSDACCALRARARRRDAATIPAGRLCRPLRVRARLVGLRSRSQHSRAPFVYGQVRGTGWWAFGLAVSCCAGEGKAGLGFALGVADARLGRRRGCAAAPALSRWWRTGTSPRLAATRRARRALVVRTGGGCRSCAYAAARRRILAGTATWAAGGMVATPPT